MQSVELQLASHFISDIYVWQRWAAALGMLNNDEGDSKTENIKTKGKQLILCLIMAKTIIQKNQKTTTAYALKEFLVIIMWNFLHLHIYRKKKTPSKTSKTKWQFCHERKILESGRVQGGEVSYLQRMREKDRMKWKEAEGREKTAVFK